MSLSNGVDLIEYNDFEIDDDDSYIDYDTLQGDTPFLEGESKTSYELMARVCADNGIPFLYEAPLPQPSTLPVPPANSKGHEVIVPWDQFPPKPNRKVHCVSIDVYDEFIKPAVAYANSTDSLDVPDSLVNIMKKFMLMDCTPSEVPGERKAKQSTTNPVIAVLNNIVYESEPTTTSAPHVLAFGGGDGLNDCTRIAFAYDAVKTPANRISIDILDIVPQHPKCRNVQVKNVMRTMKGENVPPDPAKLPSNYYDLIWAKDSTQFATRIYGGAMPAIKELVRSLKPGGTFVGSYCNGRNAISIRGPFVGNGGRGFSPHVKTLSLTKTGPHSWVQNMIVFGHVFSEPFVPSCSVEKLAYVEGGDAMVIDCDDIHKFVPFEAEHMCPELEPEAAGWSILIMRHLSFDRQFFFNGHEGTQDFVPLTKYSNLMPSRLAASGAIVSRSHVKRLINGGPYLYSEKLDGYPAVCRVDEGVLVIKTYRGIEYYEAPRVDYDVEFQCEMIDNEFTIVAIHSINDIPVTLGYGLTFLYGSVGRLLFKQFHWKIFFPAPPAYNKTKDWEGVVISKYTQPPPDKTKMEGEMNVRFCNVGLMYAKRRPTVDLISGGFAEQFGELGLRDFRTCKIAETVFTIPVGSFRNWDDVIEIFVDDGSIKCFRPDKRTGNTEDQVRRILASIPYKEVFDLFLVNKENYGRDIDEMRLNENLVNKPYGEWSTKDIAELAMSYPNGLSSIPKDARFLLEELRLSLYNNPHLLSCLDMPPTNIEDRKKFLTMLAKRNGNYEKVQKFLYSLEKTHNCV